jgi:hypothetical protein
MNKDIDNLEAALRTPEPSIADEDFTTNLLARLPPRRHRAPARRWTLAGSAALGSALTLALAPPLDTIVASISPWSIPPLALSTIAVIALVMAPALFVLYTERADR